MKPDLKALSSKLWVALCAASVLIFSATLACGNSGNRQPGTEESVNLSNIGEGSFGFSGLYHVDPVEYTPRVPPYNLPMRQSEVKNFETINGRLSLSPETLQLIKQNGFAVTENPMNPVEEYITQVYRRLKVLEVPIFITTDSLLHLYHIQFDETLRIIEEKAFYNGIWNISKALFEDFVALYGESSGDVKEEAKRNAAFFAVGLSLLEPKSDQVCQGNPFECNNWEAHFTEEDSAKYSFEVPSFVKSLVEDELKLIRLCGGFSLSPIFKYEEDYSQYVPRGHYTRSERLKNYFRAFVWYGRMSFLLKGDLMQSPNPTYDAMLQTGQAALIASRFAADEGIRETWDKIYGVTSFYVGTSDDLGPYEYLDAMRFVFGGTFSPASLTEEKIGALKGKLAEYRYPKIYGGTGNCQISPPYTAQQADNCLGNTKGFRFMGQRFIPDSYMFSNLVGPYTGSYQGTQQPFTLVSSAVGGVRGFPRGLDVMALLGSARARDILDGLDDTNYATYDKAFLALQDEFDALSDAEWSKNLYFSWLYALIPLLEECPAGYPTFMRNSAWLDKEITTALASWTELRHDTILYAKQSYTMRATSVAQPPPRVVGYVEPVPRFYNRLLALTRMTNRGLCEMDLLDEASQNRLKHLEEILLRLVQISKAELENAELTDDDYDLINDFGEWISSVIAEVDDKAKTTAIVADVHTDGNSMRVLEEGVGYVKLVLVAYRVPDGRILLGAGPVMSYYEFKQPMDSRLTDEAWRDMLRTDPPSNVEWYSNFGT